MTAQGGDLEPRWNDTPDQPSADDTPHAEWRCGACGSPNLPGFADCGYCGEPFDRDTCLERQPVKTEDRLG